MGDKKIDKYIFNLKDQIGEGSYATVYRGKDEKTGQKVAIKMLQKSVINADDYLREGLISEIKVMQKLKSPNIVGLLDVMETTNNYYIIQEFCDSGDLDHYLQQNKQMNEKDALKFMVDMLTGFIQLIKFGIIHRDLKPANILIDKGTFKLADFGFAKCVDNFKKDMMSSLVGTPLYMSPQILDNKKYTSKTDVWSLGFIFYEVLFGKTPWTARSPQELLKNIRNQSLKFPSSVSKECQDLISGCLEIQEAKRLSWDEILRHPLFQGQFNQHSQVLEDRAKYLINDLRLMILKENIDINDLFIELDMSKDKSLDVNELGKFLLRVDKNLTREEIEYLFNKFDEDGSNSIEFEEFKKWLEDNDVRMSKSQITQQAKRLQELTLPNSKPTGSIEERALYVLDKLKISIVKYNINLFDLFKKYDKSADQSLDVDEMAQMLKRIEPKLTQEEAQAVFTQFDINKDGTISFKEFSGLLQDALLLQKEKKKSQQEESKKQS